MEVMFMVEPVRTVLTCNKLVINELPIMLEYTLLIVVSVEVPNVDVTDNEFVVMAFPIRVE